MRKFMIVFFLYTSQFSGIAQNTVRFFEGNRISQSSIQLNWITAAGNTCSDLFIERSAYLSNFNEVYRHSGVCGSTLEEINYFWVDNEALSGISYYRIQEAFGLYADTIEVLNPIGIDEVLLFPNPASNEINIYRTNSDAKTSSLLIYDLRGKLILETEIPNQLTSINTSKFIDGMYYFHYISSAFKITKKVIILSNP
jgi:hypothetical protein